MCLASPHNITRTEAIHLIIDWQPKNFNVIVKTVPIFSGKNILKIKMRLSVKPDDYVLETFLLLQQLFFCCRLAYFVSVLHKSLL